MLRSMTEQHFLGALWHSQGPAASAAHELTTHSHYLWPMFLHLISILAIPVAAASWNFHQPEMPMAFIAHLLSRFGCDFSLQGPANHYTESVILELLVIP